MPALSYHKLSYVRQSIKTLCEQRLKLHTIELTHDDYMKLWVRPEHRKMVREISDVIQVSWKASSFRASIPMPSNTAPDNAAEVAVNVSLVGDNAPAVVKYAGKAFARDAEPETIEKIQTWLNERIAIGFEFGLAHSLVDYLSDHCKSAQVMRFMWPSLTALLAMNEQTQELADRVRDMKVPGTVPSLPVDVREACRRASGTIAAAQLLSEVTDEEPKKAREVAIDLPPDTLTTTSFGPSLGYVKCL